MAFMQCLRGLWRLGLFVALNNTDRVTARLTNEQLPNNHAWLTYYRLPFLPSYFESTPYSQKGVALSIQIPVA